MTLLNIAETKKSHNYSTLRDAFRYANPNYPSTTSNPEPKQEYKGLEFKNAPDELLAGLYVSKGTEWAFNELVNRYSSMIYNLGYKYTRNESYADDVLQEVLLTLFQKLKTFRGESKFSTWVYGITKNTSFMYLKKQMKHMKNLSLTKDSYTEGGDLTDMITQDWRFIPDTVLMEEEKRYKIDQAMSSIPEIYSTVLRLSDLEGRTNVEIGEILGISLPAVKSRIRRARMQLRKSLKQYGIEELY